MYRKTTKYLLLLAICTLSFDCKPRTERSALRGEVDDWISENVDNFKKIEEEIAELENLRMKAPFNPLAGEKELEDSNKERKNTFPYRPNGCGEKGWKNEIAWNNPALAELYQKIVSKQKPVSVRAKAMEVFTSMVARENLYCHIPVLEHLLPQAFLDNNPPDEFVFKETLTAPNNASICSETDQTKAPAPGTWRCSKMLSCSQVRESLHKIVPVLFNSDTLTRVICEARNSAAFLNYSDTIFSMMQYSYDTTFAYKRFLESTQMRRPDFHGREIGLDQETLPQLKAMYKHLILGYKSLFSARNNEYTSPQVEAGIGLELIKRDIVAIPNANPSILTEDQLALINEYAKDTLRIVPQAFEYNWGTLLYMDYLEKGHLDSSGRDKGRRTPNDWINDLKKRVALGKKLFQKQMDLQTSENRESRREKRDSDPVGDLSISEAKEIYSRANIRFAEPSKNSEDIPYAINPVVAFRAVTNFIDHESQMPFSSDFKPAAFHFLSEIAGMKDSWAGSIGKRIVISLLPEIQAINAYYSAKEDNFNSAASLLSKANSKYIEQLDKYTKEQYYLHQRDVQVLIERERDIAIDPNMRGFDSLTNELNRLGKKLTMHAHALHAFQCTLRANDKEMPGCVDKNAEPLYREKTLFRDGSFEELNRIWLDPGSGRNRQQITMKENYGDLLGQWVVFKCLAKRYDRSGKPPVIDEEFYVDGRKVKFDCLKEGGKDLTKYTDLRFAAMKYGGSIGLKEVEKLMADAIKNHPSIHTIIVIALGPALGVLSPLTGLIKLGFSAVNAAVRGAMYARYAVMAARTVMDLAVQSYLFGIFEHYASKQVHKIASALTGFEIEVSEEEMALHGSPFTNWAGMAQGALIFGAIPLAHKGAAKLVSFLFKRGTVARAVSVYAKTAALPAQFAKRIPLPTRMMAFGYHATSALAESTAELALFTGLPIVQQSYAELQTKLDGSYRQTSDFDKALARMYKPSFSAEIASHLLTVVAFSSNRYTQQFINGRVLGTPVQRQGKNPLHQMIREGYRVDQIRHEIDFFRMKILDWKWMLQGKSKRDPKIREERKAQWILGINKRQANNAANVKEAYDYKLGEIAQAKAMLTRSGMLHPRSWATLNLRARKLEGAHNELMAKLDPKRAKQQIEKRTEERAAEAKEAEAEENQ